MGKVVNRIILIQCKLINYWVTIASSQYNFPFKTYTDIPLKEGGREGERQLETNPMMEDINFEVISS